MKKVLSLVLSLCLFVSLGAGISFDVASAAAVDAYYDFTVAATATTQTHWQSLTTYDAVNALDTASKSADWAFNSFTGSSGSYMYYVYAGQGIYVRNGDYKGSTTAQIKFKVDNAGKYVPFLDMAGGADWTMAGLAKVSIHQLNGATVNPTAIASKYINMANYTNGSFLEPLSDLAVNLAAGEYVLQFAFVQGACSLKVNGLKLAAAESNIPVRINLGNTEGLYEVNVDEQIKIPFTVDLSDGSKLDVANAKGWTNSADTDYTHIRIAKDTSTLDITGKAVTSANDAMWIKLGNAVANFNVKVNAAGTVKAARDLYYNFKKVTPKDVKFNGGDFLYYANTWNYGTSTNGAYGEARHDITSDPWTIVYTKDQSGVENQSIYFCSLQAGQPILWYYGKTYVDIAIKVPADGYYTPAIDIGSVSTITSTASDASFSIRSLDGKTTYATKAFATGTAAGKHEISDAPIRLTAGEYIISMNKSNNGHVYLNGAELAYEGGLDYNVTLNANGGTVAADLTSYTYGVGATLPAATKDGYNFDGWYTTADFSGDAVTAIPATAKGDKVYYAKFTYIPKTFAVNLNLNGGTASEGISSYTEGVGATLPAATKAGYVFGGWYDNAECIGTAVTAIGTDATGDKTFYAKWTLDVSAADFTVTASSGYYAYYVSNPNREGVIAVTAAFAKYETAPISKAGIMVYVAGNENNEAKIARVEATAADIAADANFAGTVSALFDGIAKENFDKEVLAKAYVVIDGEYVYSEAITTSVDSSRWVGVKPR